MGVTEAACCSLHFPQLHCQAAPSNRRAKNLLIPSVVLGLGAFSVLRRCCRFQISRFSWAKFGLIHLNMCCLIQVMVSEVIHRSAVVISSVEASVQRQRKSVGWVTVVQV